MKSLSTNKVYQCVSGVQVSRVLLFLATLGGCVVLCCAVLCCATNCTTMITNYIPHLIRRNKCRCGCKCNCIGHLKKETNKQASYFPTRGSRISRDYGLITSHHMSGMLSESIDPICSNQTYSLSILHAPLLSLDDVCIGYCSTAMRHRPSIPSTN